MDAVFIPKSKPRLTYDSIKRACELIGLQFSPSVAMRFRMGIAPDGWTQEQFEEACNQIRVTAQCHGTGLKPC